MKTIEFIIKVLMAVILFLPQLNAQTLHENLNSSGGNFHGSGGTVSQSVGQLFYTIATGTGGSVNQGIQQPFEISVVTEIKEAAGISLMMSAYPNPTTGLLKLRINDLRFDNLIYQLFDANGKLLETRTITGIETEIDLQYREPAVYFLKVIRRNEIFKTFKILKTH